MRVTVINPATEEVVGTLPAAGPKKVQAAVERARKAQRLWRETSIDDRAAALQALARELKGNAKALGETMAREMGKPIRDAVAEAEKCAWLAEHFAAEGKHLLADESVPTEAKRTVVAHEPLGVCAAIMPWNYPLWLPARFGVPAVMAGNAVVLKPSSVSPYSGLALADAFRAAGAPEGLFQTVVGGGRTGDALLDAAVDFVAFTGSVETGRRIAKRAGERGRKCILELGGSDPFLVTADADLQAAAEAAVQGRFRNCGQTCIAAKRFYVVEFVAEEFMERFQHATERMNVGDPMDWDAEMGPMAREDQRVLLEEQLRDTLSAGATLVRGGKRMERKGFFFEPTIVTGVREEMRLMREESFGPAAPVAVVKDEDEAVALANASEFGLAASVWSRDREKAEALARRLEVGMVYVNGVVRSDPRLPFGGVKASGFGRELGRHGLLETVNVKPIVIY